MDPLFAIRMPPVIESVTIGEHHALVIDDFLQNPMVMKEIAARSQFSAYPGVPERKGYPGLRARAPEDYSSALTALSEQIIKVNFDVPIELGIRKSICMYSLTTTPPDELGPLQCTPHFDASTPHHMAVLLYLCDQQHGGTGFYRHNATGFQQITAENREHYLDTYYEEMNAKRPLQRYFDDSNDQFTFLGMIPAKFNRLVVYRGSLLHSACINPAISINPDPLPGRLTVNTFYDF
ncbi:DUF6445 family protein [Undibacterium sp. SXout20W]|uniref:DUF6445 family protein n=1 Tax=Undibacterium sp. SXout20W TaxID=3413051 RepID=UPI003BF59A2D